MYKAEQCYMDRATFMSLFSVTCYLFLVIVLILGMLKPDYSHQSRQSSGIDLDEVSMPSYLGSIGTSLGSQSRESRVSASGCNSSLSSNSADQMKPIPENSILGIRNCLEQNNNIMMTVISEKSSSEDEDSEA